MEERKVDDQAKKPGAKNADDWSTTDGHDRMSATWPLVVFGLLLLGMIGWGLFGS